jgi:hypothetical protein
MLFLQVFNKILISDPDPDLCFECRQYATDRIRIQQLMNEYLRIRDVFIVCLFAVASYLTIRKMLIMQRMQLSITDSSSAAMLLLFMYGKICASVQSSRFLYIGGFYLDSYAYRTRQTILQWNEQTSVKRFNK